MVSAKKAAARALQVSYKQRTSHAIKEALSVVQSLFAQPIPDERVQLITQIAKDFHGLPFKTGDSVTSRSKILSLLITCESAKNTRIKYIFPNHKSALHAYRSVEAALLEELLAGQIEGPEHYLPSL